MTLEEVDAGGSAAGVAVASSACNLGIALKESVVVPQPAKNSAEIKTITDNNLYNFMSDPFLRQLLPAVFLVSISFCSITV